MGVVYWIPLATSVVAIGFASVVLRRWRSKRGLHLLWWGVGLLLYGAGTITESLTTLFGWHPWVFQAWYITGALCGGAPLAQGTVYLLLPRRVAHFLAAALVATVVIAAGFVIASPIDTALVEPHRLSGRVLEWRWVRLVSPFINTYAATFLIGGAVVSALRARADAQQQHRFAGNVLIAVGALLPGVGGAFTRFGHVEVLYVTEFVGLLLIFAGFRRIVSRSGEPLEVLARAAG